MKKFFLFAVIIYLLTAISFAQETSPSPLPLLNPVPKDKVIKPGEGLGDIRFGCSISDVEKKLGKGKLIPGDTDQRGNNEVTLTYKDKGLIFKFLNGQLGMIIIDKPGYATPTGVQVGGDVGDLIREFGARFIKNQSLLDKQDPERRNIYELIFIKKYIAANIKGNIITRIRIMSSKKIKKY